MDIEHRGLGRVAADDDETGFGRGGGGILAREVMGDALVRIPVLDLDEERRPARSIKAHVGKSLLSDADFLAHPDRPRIHPALASQLLAEKIAGQLLEHEAAFAEER